MSTRTHTITAPDGTVKRAIPPPRTKDAAPEPPDARCKRLVAAARLNGVRVRNNQDGTFTVPSQRRTPTGAPVTHYTVTVYAGLGLLCTCPWAAGDALQGIPEHGLYCDENRRALCAHAACVLVYQERAAATERRQRAWLATTVARIVADAPPILQDRIGLANAPLTPEQAWDDLFTEHRTLATRMDRAVAAATGAVPPFTPSPRHNVSEGGA